MGDYPEPGSNLLSCIKLLFSFAGPIALVGYQATTSCDQYFFR
jgi:hypothetical protein